MCSCLSMSRIFYFDASSGVRMAVSPSPVFLLLFVAERRKLSALIVPFGKPHAVRSLLAGIPILIVRIIVVVNAYARRASADRQRRQKRSRKQHRTQEPFCPEHFVFSSTVALREVDALEDRPMNQLRPRSVRNCFSEKTNKKMQEKVAGSVALILAVPGESGRSYTI